jgi:hypothetical protein
MSIDAYDLSSAMIGLCERERVLFTHIDQAMETKEAMLPDSVMPLFFMYAVAEAKKGHLNLTPEITFFSSSDAACQVEMVVDSKDSTFNKERRRKSFLTLFGCLGLKSIIDDISRHGVLKENSVGWRILESRWIMAALYHKHGDVYDSLLQQDRKRQDNKDQIQQSATSESSSMNPG